MKFEDRENSLKMRVTKFRESMTCYQMVTSTNGEVIYDLLNQSLDESVF